MADMQHPYATEAYAQTLGHIGRPVAVPEWGCSVLARPIDGEREDVTGCYPVATLTADADIVGGLTRLRDLGFVSVTLAIDDFHRPPIPALEQTFDLVRPFKSHFLVSGGLDAYRPSDHHRYEIKRAINMVRTTSIDLKAYAAEWGQLYAALGERHQFGQAHAFPASSFDALADIPGVETIGGFCDGQMVSCHIWIRDRDTVHSHLAASSPLGYCRRAAYAVNDASVRYFADARIINFGGGAGLNDVSDNGLARFKKGFSNAVAPSYICGAVLDAKAYAALSSARAPASASGFFPAYRAR